jgi:hypothetical protein
MPDDVSMIAPQAPSAAGAEPAWFVQAAGQVWGPYSRTRIERFVVEGRLTPLSLVSAHREGPFEPAGARRGLSSLFRDAEPYRHQPAPSVATEPASVALPQREPAPDQAPTTLPKFAPRLDSPEVAPSGGALRPLLVWADLESLSAPQFEALLARYGDFVAVRPAVWLVQSRIKAAALRNALSRRLTGADTLMIVHAPLDHAAWFNLDSAAERTLRKLWAG